MSALSLLTRHARRAGLGAWALLACSVTPAWAQTPIPRETFSFRPAPVYDPSIPDPVALLGFEVGEDWSTHRDLLRVTRAIGEASDRVLVEPYGRTPEGRDLLLAFVSSPRNLARREVIRREILALAHPTAETTLDDARRRIADLPAIVWLSYNVHGNEPSPSECALEILYHLAAGGGDEVARLLDEVFIVLDPCLNPDGRDRYVHWFQSVVGPEPDPNPAAREHHEPAPQGRSNHYYFDLNRDWAFASQPETRQRRTQLMRWRPQVHVDYHEMYPEASYFFFPSARPRNENFPESILSWGERFGAGNAAYFDRYGWEYYTAESFDLFYPGYGDSWPSLIGAIGMTYEQGGHSPGGLTYRRQNGSILTLRDRVAHHYGATLATLETARAGRRDLLLDFFRFHADGLREGRIGPMREIALIPGSDPQPLERLVAELLEQSVVVERAMSAFVATGVHDYAEGRREERVFPEGTMLVPLEQPLKHLVKTMLEPQATVEEVAFYDLAAWSLPLAFGVEASWFETTAPVERATVTDAPRAVPPALEGGDVVGWIVDWNRQSSPRAVLELLGAGWPARFAGSPFTLAGRRFPAGSVFFPAGERSSELAAALDEVRERLGVPVVAARSFLTERGIDLGSNGMVDLATPRIGLLAATSSSFGEFRHLLEETLVVPHSVLNLDALDARTLGDFNILLVPDGVPGLGAASSLFETFGALGGTVIAVGGSASFFTAEQSELTSVTMMSGDEDDEGEDEEDDAWRTRRDARRRSALDALPGTFYEATLDPDHPLAFGVPERLPVLVRGRRAFRSDGGGTLVARLDASRQLSGYAGEDARASLEDAFWVAEASLGRGRVIMFSEAPAFRLGFQGAIRVLLNAIALSSR